MNASPEVHPDGLLESGFRLEGLTVDPRAGDVSGPGGRETLDPKVMDVLVVLAQRAGQVVLREDLLKKVWPGAVVTDDALSRCVYELRRQLTQAGGDERYKSILETLPKRGYRLNGNIAAPKSPQGSPEPPQSPEVPGWSPTYRRVVAIASTILLAGGAWFVTARLSDEPQRDSTHRASPATKNSIAVLPFVDMSAAQDQRYLADGIADEILNRLTRIPDLRVIARTSSFTFRDQQADIREIASKLDVSHVLEGSVRRVGDHVRITTQLIETSSDSHLWSRTYDRALVDLFAVQDEIAASVATALDLSLGDATRDYPPPDNAAAYEPFLQAEFFWGRRAPGDVERAARYYEDAVALEPNYARAWASLSRTYSLLADAADVSGPVLRAKQGEAAHRAVALAPRVAGSHYTLAQFYYETGDRENAHKHFQTAATLAPDLEASDSTKLATLPSSDLEAEIEHQRQVVARGPLAATNRAILGVLLTAAGQLEEAESEFLKAKELSPEFEGIDREIIRVLVLQRRYDEAYAACLRLPEGEARDHGLALLFEAPDRRPEADVALGRLVEGRGPDLGSNVRLAEVYAHRGMTEEAISTLQGYKNTIDLDGEAADSEIWWLQREMSVSPFLAPLHADPRWKELMAELT